MRVKVGTSINPELLKKAQQIAAHQGKRLNDVLEDALEQYLQSANQPVNDDVVTRTWGGYRIEAKTLRRIMDEDVFDT